MNRAQLSGETHEQRIRRLLAVIGRKMGVSTPQYGGKPEVPPSDYSCWTHRIHVDEETARVLADSELAMLLAHEVGHSTRRGPLIAARLAVLLPVAVGTAMSKGWLDLDSTVNLMLMLASVAWAALQIARSPQHEEFIADDFAVAFVGSARPYKELLQRLAAQLGKTPGPVLRKRLQRLCPVPKE